MSRDPLDMTGLWHGAYGYPAYAGPTTPFVAHVVDTGGSLNGAIIEPNTMGRTSEELEAFLRGSRQGRAVDFTKTYDGASDAAHSVDYVGQLAGDGLSVTGVWSLEDMDGTFEMWRDKSVEEAAEREVVEELEVPVTRD